MSLTNEQIKQLESIYPMLSSVIRSLEPVVKKSVMDEIVAIKEIVSNVFKVQWKEEADEDDQEYKRLSKISKQEKFKSVWSISEVKAAQLDTSFSEKNVKGIVYESWGDKKEVSFGKAGKKMTWMDMWREADKLMRQSGDDHHIFIEDFNEVKDKKGYYSLSCGS
jgi:hypothetical protein